jgi:hypothetical protein
MVSMKRPRPKPKANRNRIGLAMFIASEDQMSFNHTIYWRLTTAMV